ncbi:MAG: sugar phosphate nucleotidyltransferase [Kofleriaceae bacterium]
MRHAVILAGGAGTRLWPASRRPRPKQYLPLAAGGASLLTACARRARAAVGEVVVVTTADQADLAAAAIAEVAPTGVILSEPAPRNTAAAIGLAAVHLRHRDPDAVMAILPADQRIGDEPAMAALLGHALEAVEAADVIGTLGVVPTRAETGFGYLELGDAVPGAVAGLHAVARFVEKPDAERARAYLAGGRHLWNAGMFFLRADRLLAELRRHLPATADGLDEIARALAAGPAAAAAATARIYPTLPSISIDHAVMERAADVVTLRAEVGWDDVGSWEAIAAHAGAGTTVELDGGGNVVYDDAGGVVALLGVSDLVVVRAGDAVLVMPRARAQEVRAVVDELARRGLDRFL